MPEVRCAAYIRVSTDNQALRDEGSLETQEARLRAAVAALPGHVINRVFREEGESGKSLDRPQMRQLVRAVRSREIDKVMVVRLDRLSRSLLDFCSLQEFLEQHEVGLHSLNESLDTTSPLGRAMVKLLMVFAELEREQTADRTRQAMTARASRGLWNGGRPPLGYDSDGNGHLAVNEEESRLVRTIFDKYVELRSAPALANWLTDNGHRQKKYVSRRKGPTGGKPFTAAGVRHVLRNPLYLGKVQHKGEVFEGQHPALVEQAAFDQVETILAGNSKNKRATPRSSQHDYLLTSLLQCACGYALTSSSGKGTGGTYFYYRCVGVQKHGKKHPCDVRQVRAERLEEAVLAVVRDAASDPALVDRAIAEAEALARDRIGPLDVRLQDLRRELASVEDEGRRTLETLLAAGVAGSSFGADRLRQLEERRAQLTQAVAEGEGELAVHKGAQLDREALVQALQSFDRVFNTLSLGERKDFLERLVHNAVVHPDRIEVHLYDGREALVWLDDVRAVRKSVRSRVPTSADASRGDPQTTNRQRPGKPEFADGSEWLPQEDLNLRHPD